MGPGTAGVEGLAESERRHLTEPATTAVGGRECFLERLRQRERNEISAATGPPRRLTT